MGGRPAETTYLDKAKVAMEAVKGKQTAAELAQLRGARIDLAFGTGVRNHGSGLSFSIIHELLNQIAGAGLKPTWYHSVNECHDRRFQTISGVTKCHALVFKVTFFNFG